MKTALLCFAALCFVACSGEIKYNQVPIAGLHDCGAGLYYKFPLKLELSRPDASIKTVVTDSNDERVSIRSDKTTTWSVRVGICQNDLGKSTNYSCTDPTTWYHEAKFRYDPQNPKPLTIPKPKTAQTCVPL